MTYDAPATLPRGAADPVPLRRELLSLLLCPEDHGPLVGWDGVQPEALLVCATCAATYPIRGGVPCLLPAALREAKDAPAVLEDQGEIAEKRREMAARDAQAYDYDRMLGLKLFTGAELPLSQRFLAPAADHLVLEAGCGTGRMTASFARASRGVIALDFSMESIRANMAKLTPPTAERVLFIQADISRLPLRTESFDRVGSFGVYEHLPSDEARDRAVAEMVRVLKSRDEGGRIAFSAYRWGVPQCWLAPREGHHAGGIYFRRFTMRELRSLVAPHIAVGGYSEALLYYHLVWGRKHAR